jgi:hypothetical protein
LTLRTLAKAELGSTYGIGLGVFYFISEWNTLTRPVDRFCAVARLFKWNRFVQVRAYGGGWICVVKIKNKSR